MARVYKAIIEMKRYFLHLEVLILQKRTAVNVLTAVARMAGPVIAAGFTLPYWLR